MFSQTEETQLLEGNAHDEALKYYCWLLMRSNHKMIKCYKKGEKAWQLGMEILSISPLK